MGRAREWRVADGSEEAGFDVLLTSDKNKRKIAIVVLGNPQWPIVRLHVELVVAAVNAATPGSYT